MRFEEVRDSTDGHPRSCARTAACSATNYSHSLRIQRQRTPPRRRALRYAASFKIEASSWFSLSVNFKNFSIELRPLGSDRVHTEHPVAHFSLCCDKCSLLFSSERVIRHKTRTNAIGQVRALNELDAHSGGSHVQSKHRKRRRCGSHPLRR